VIKRVDCVGRVEISNLAKAIDLLAAVGLPRRIRYITCQLGSDGWSDFALLWPESTSKRYRHTHATKHLLTSDAFSEDIWSQVLERTSWSVSSMYS
jgi:hypothetical protein